VREPREDLAVQKSGSMVRIGTGLGLFVVEIRNDLGPVADGLADAVEASVLSLLREHRGLVEEMRTVDIQRAEFDYEMHQLKTESA
jgi:hypothetical protein